MSDIVQDAKAWLETRPARRFGDGRTHHPTCHETHIECLVARLVAEVERHRMTPEERKYLTNKADEWDDVLWHYLDRTAPETNPPSSHRGRV